MSVLLNPFTGRLQLGASSGGGGGGDVVGPAASTDKALVRWDGTTGKLVQDGVVLETNNGELLGADGAATGPSYSFNGDADTGMWHSGTDTLDFATSGVNRLSLNGLGVLISDGGITVNTGNLQFNQGLVVPYRTGSSDTSVTTTEYIISMIDTSAPYTVDLPSNPALGQIFIIKDASGAASVNNITVTVLGGGVSIDGLGSQIINIDWGYMQLVFNGANYLIIG